MREAGEMGGVPIQAPSFPLDTDKVWWTKNHNFSCMKGK